MDDEELKAKEQGSEVPAANPTSRGETGDMAGADDHTHNVSACDVGDVTPKGEGESEEGVLPSLYSPCTARTLVLSLVSVEPAQVKRQGAEGAPVRHDDDLVGTRQSLSSTLKNMTSSGTSLLFMTSSKNCWKAGFASARNTGSTSQLSGGERKKKQLVIILKHMFSHVI